MSLYNLSTSILFHRKLEDYFFSSISQMHWHIGAGIRAYITGVEADTLNFLQVINESAQITEELKSGIQLLDEKGNVPFLIVAVQPSGQILAVIEQTGFVADPDSITTVMELDLTNWQMEDEHCGKYEIRCVDHCLPDWAIPLESAFETGDAISGQYMKCHQAALRAGKCLQHYALYVDEKPVCALTLSRVDNIVRLDDISTVKENMRRGYASALINYVLNEARERGATACYLEASREGNGVYRRIGFNALFECQAFIR
ncbi:GNAT family N-acetyltransferase [Xenorhabdus innexi]|uniref:N-acetyltransferase n=1 Tax=Xenorhabdus innexi TaxID=290109 RepID=A0A1N6MQD0_9GAMM|nr:GNAT family N-acetyltransferase [Xenorhabdus innexi]PHM28793.1 N-acetyltransferase [Xenorhabdus innexi]SIP70964.1 putative Acetyltransferase, GNAT family family [Xenorhabdus innexi]